MKILEFQTEIRTDDTVKVPPEISAQIQKDQPIRVILLISESTDDHQWANLTVEQFMKGYADSDAIYDQLSAG